MNNTIKVYVLVSFYDENGLHKQGTIATINEEEFNPMYMKKIEGGGGSTVEVDQIVSTGTKIATITVDSDATDIYAPEGSGGGSVIDNILTDGDGHVESMEIDGSTYEFGTGETTIDQSYIETDSDGKVKSMDIDGSTYDFTSIENIDTDSEGKVKSMYINGSNSEFVSIENISTQGPNGEVDSMDINGNSYIFAAGGSGSTIENIEQNQNTDMVASMDIDNNSYNFVTALHELDETDILSPQDGDCLVFDGTNGVWKEGKPKAQKIKLILKSTQSTGTIRDIPTVGTSITLQIDTDHGGKMTDNMLTNGYDFMIYDTYDNAYFIISSFSINTNEPTMIILDNHNTQNVHAFEVTVSARSGSGSNSPWTELTIKRTV